MRFFFLKILLIFIPLKSFEAKEFPQIFGCFCEGGIITGQLLDKAGWKVIKGKRIDSNGNSLKIEILNYSPAFDRIINPFIESLKLLGIDAVHTRIDSTQYTERVREFDWDIITSTYGNSISFNGYYDFSHNKWIDNIDSFRNLYIIKTDATKRGF